MMISREDYRDVDYGINPYESFMRKHLQHYGYYTGKNQNYKNHFQQFADWEKNYAYSLCSSSNSSTDSDSDEEEKSTNSKIQEELHRTTQLIYSYGESGKMVPRLREPRSLYALNKELGPQQAARWPSDLQVIKEKVRHIPKVSSDSEPFYKATGFEKCPMARGEANGGRIIYCNENHSSFFMKSRVGGSKNGSESSSVQLESDSDTTLLFESRFESGNLGKAVQVGETEYELWLQYDLYTNKHTQWFYFRVTNTRADTEYRFTIVNFMKPDSLYNDGMRPLLYSEKDAAINKVGWVRGGQDIKYYKNNLRYESGKAERSYYSLTWTVKFKHDRDAVYFSHCYPYTYTDLQDYLLELTNDPIKSRICKQRVLCQTLAGNLVYVLTITSASQSPEDMKHKKAVVVTSRVHPGESNASWMMKGIMDFLTGNSPDAKLLRDTFIFKIVPMLNPDGVIVGNYRCSLAGRDLNRNYKTVLKDAYPSVWHTKTMIRKLLQERDIIVYCDLHGHSRRQNVFIYGCEQHHRSYKRFHERIFPFMLSKNTPDKFCFNSCKFKVQKSKESTGRVVMWNLGILNSYTMEATFCGSSLGKSKGHHFNQNDFEMMGYHFCDTLLDYCDPDNTKFLKTLNDLEEKHRMQVLAKIAQKGLQPENVDINDLSTDTESSDGGSDSSASDGPPVHLQFATARQPKKKKMKSKKDRDKGHTGKEEQNRRQSEQEDKRGKNNKTKQLKQDLVKPQVPPVKYTTTGPKRPRSLDDRSNSGIPVFVQERFEEKRQRKHNYLEALTAAYLRHKIPFVTDPGQKDGDAAEISRQLQRLTLATADVWSPAVMTAMSQTAVHLGHSDSCSDCSSSAQTSEEVCNHHNQTFPAQFPSRYLKNYAGRKSGHPKSALSRTSLHKVTPQLQQEDASKIYPTSRVERGDSAFTISRLIGRGEVTRSDVPYMEDILRTRHAQTVSFSLLNRRHKPHLLEVSAAQQKQTDALLRDKNGPIKMHPNPFDEKSESAVNGSQNHPARMMSSQSSHKTITTVSSIPSSKDENPAAGSDRDAGSYIQELIRETREEINDLTNEIQEDIEKKHQQLAKNSNKNSPHSHTDELNHRQTSDSGSHQKVKLDMGYHGPTFINYLDSTKTLNDKSSSNDSVRRKSGTRATATLAADISKSSDLKKPVEVSSNTSASMPPINPKKVMSGLNLVAGNNEHKETSIEEQARARNLRRQASFNTSNPGAYLRSSYNSKNPLSPINFENSNDFLLPDMPPEPGYFVAPAQGEGDKNVKSNIQQLNFSSHSYYQSNQKPAHTNRIKCSQHTLVFRPDTSEEQVYTPGGSYQYRDNQEERRTELGDSGKKMRLSNHPS